MGARAAAAGRLRLGGCQQPPAVPLAPEVLAAPQDVDAEQVPFRVAAEAGQVAVWVA